MNYRHLLMLQFWAWLLLAVFLFVRHVETWGAWLTWSLTNHPNLTLAAMVFIGVPLIGLTFHLLISKSQTK